MNIKFRLIVILCMLGTVLAACATKAAAPTPAALELKMDSQEIAGKIELEPMRFTTTAGQVFTGRTTPYDEPGFSELSSYDGSSIQTQLKDLPLIATRYFTPDGSDSWVSVTLDGKEIYSIPTGNGYTLDPLQALWVYGEHWALETVHITTHTRDNLVTADLVGQVSVDGVLLNEEKGYAESFGFQTLAGQPFYFFKRDGKMGYSYNGQETTLEYDTILHYGCCSAGALNPVSTPNHVDFFAKKGQTDYFVILGLPQK